MTLDITRFAPSLLVIGALFAVGCPSVDDSDPVDTDVPTVLDPPPTQTAEGIQGTWVSEGEDLSSLFVFSGIASVDATFNADGTYDVTSTDGEGATTDFTGTFVVDISGAVPSIVLEQETPYVATAVGIWQVEADGSMRYEVTQTVPDLGFAPATAAGGFGSTSGPGLAAGANVQTYR